MTDPVIQVNGISKKYRLGQKMRHDTLRDEIAGAAKTVVNFVRDQTVPRLKPGEFWALKDVSFNVEKGEALGIIGKNGSGKSTLLKVLSRITFPTAGEIRIRGKVASLLEVGTGFSPELSGRENIFLNGAILGMTQKEIKAKFDEIVDFSEIEKFIDTPVKHYSSGMYMRLAFAIAAHLDPDILLVDEVLAVGDMEFQKKCLGKMDEVTKAQGRTVLFVSHNITAIQNLCPRSVLLDEGKVVQVGETGKVIDYYLQSVKKGTPLENRHDRKQKGNIRLTSFHVEKNGTAVSTLETGADYVFCFTYETVKKSPVKDVAFWSAIIHQNGLPLFQLDTNYTDQNFKVLPPKGTVRCLVRHFPLVSGVYQISAAVRSGDDLDMVKNAGVIDVKSGNYFGNGPVEEHGQIFVNQQWATT